VIAGRRRGEVARAALIAVAALLGMQGDAFAWGFAAHRIVNARAIGTLPEPLRAWYGGNAAWIAEHSIDADLERDRSDDPDHFLDFDAFGTYPFPDVGEDEAEHLRRFGAEARAKGRVPWRIAEDHRDLVAAFRAGDLARVLRRSASVAHLIADAHVPLHATLNHDGQLTGQKGLHSRWESELVERFRRQIEPEVLPVAAAPARNPVALTLAALRESYLHSLEVLASDRAVAGPRDFAETPEDDRYDDAYYSRLFEREAARVRSRLAASASAAGSLWLAAWEEAGRPALDARFRLPYVRGQARAVLLSLDGAAAEVIDDAVARGVMPRLAALRARGATARGAISALPTKTAPGHAALFTGAWGDRNGIVGNEVPVPGGSVLEVQSGYSSTPLGAEPIWHAAARQDLDAVVVTGTQVHPFSAYTDDRRFRGYTGRRLTLFDGYQNLDAEDGVITEATLAWKPAGDTLAPLPAHDGEARQSGFDVAGARVDAWTYDDPSDPTAGFDTVLLATDGDPSAGIALKATPPRDEPDAFRALTIPLAGGESTIFFRLHSLSGDGSRLLLYHTAPHVLRASKPRLESAAQEAAGGFVGNAAAWSYEQGRLGPPMSQGGDGTAEARYVETIALVTRQFARLNDFAFERTAWDLLVTYLPFPDEALHRWYGVLDPTLAGHDPDAARRLRPYLDRVLAIIDAYVGQVADRAGRDAIVAVASDHGMTSAARHFKPNVVLARAGILGLDTAGRVDLTRTRAVYFPGNSGYVLVNRQGRPGGIVVPSEEEDVRRRVAAVLTAFEDPATGRPLGVTVTDVRAPHDGPKLGGPHAGDLFVEVGSGEVGLSARVTGDALEARRPEGTHFQKPGERRMHGSFVIAGPGVAAGADLGVIHQVDIAPTLAALLGLDPLAHAVGKPLTAAMAHRP
jgi:predicted AlkP superfamily phosphohydrolase/phosphomutase